MSGRDNRRRNAIALALSATFHVLFLAMIVNETATPYALPHFASEPVEVEITPEETIKQPPIIPPKIRELLRRLERQQPPPPPPIQPPAPPVPEIRPPTPPTPPKPTQPQPNPPTLAPPAPATPTPARPAPPKPNPLPAAPAASQKPAPPAPAPSPSPSPQPGPKAAPSAVVAPPNPSTAKIAAPVVVTRPSMLNIHKPALETPSGVPTLPMAPSAQGGGPATGGGGPGGGQAGGSRLNGLSPWPYGAMPSGGPGLRGTLVGCANAEAVGLSSVERAHCNSRFGDEARRAPQLDPIDPAKRSQFDRAADKQARERSSQMPVGTQPGLGGFGGLGAGPP